MRMNMVLAITSPTAFLKVGEKPSIDLAMESLRSMGPSFPLTIAINQELSDSFADFLGNQKNDVDILICEPTDPHSFVKALVPRCVDIDALLIHDASRPLTTREQFERVLAEFADATDAVRPAMAFTETLKILDADSVIMKTLERSTVLRIATPELIRVSAIDVNGTDCGWFLPLRKDARTVHVEASPQSLRINTVEDRDLMELIAD